MPKLNNLPPMGLTFIWRNPSSKAIQFHIDSAHGGKIDPDCKACKEIQERYGKLNGD